MSSAEVFNPKSKIQNRKSRLLLIAVLYFALLAVGLTVFGWVRAAKLEGLFRGTEETASARATGFTPQLVYDLRDYLSRPAGDNEDLSASEEIDPYQRDHRLDYVDSAGREELEAEFRKTYGVDGASGATRVARLISPTIYKESRLPRFLTVTEPPDNALFPANLCPPVIEWSDHNNDWWQVCVTVPGTPLQWTGTSDERKLQLPDDVWAKIRGLAPRRAVLVVKGVKRSGLWSRARETVHVSKPVAFAVSTDAADRAVVFRQIDPPFSRFKTPNVYVRDLGEKDARVFLKSRREYCFNCHQFSNRSGTSGKMAIQVRYLGFETKEEPTYLAVYDIARKTGERVILPFKLQMTTFMSWSPDGKKLAYSANQQLATLPPIVHETQVAGESTSDIGIYDTERARTWLLPGASDPKLLEIFPNWSADGKYVVFSSAPAGLYPSLTHYRLHMVPLNGGRGGKAVPVPGTERPDKSDYFARWSPDGKWFTFARADADALLKSSSDIWIMSADFKGEARPLECNAPCATDSWYSWSSNSRWIVFVSKREDGVYGRMYLTHIDERGHASPAVKVPVWNPPMMSANVPEFTIEVPKIDEPSLFNGVNADEKAIRPKNSVPEP
jgi:Tol biopolymer transport system component